MATGTDFLPLFKSRSVALVGASDKNPWCARVLESLLEIGFAGSIHLVNRTGEPALGRTTWPSCKAIGVPVDAAFVAVPAAALEGAIGDVADAGIPCGVVLTSGFSETGERGAAEQERLFAKSRDLGLTLLGPNSLGFISFVDGVALAAMKIPTPRIIAGGGVALISQSGATTTALMDYAARQGIGLSHAVALGNEATVGLAEIMEYFLQEDDTRAIAVYAEAIRNSAGFLKVCDQALLAGKPIVILKVGAGELAAQVAMAHTGALVGDDRAFDAACRHHGVIRVYSLEQLMLTADLLAFTGVMDARGIAALSISGGACGLIADLGSAAAVPFAALTAETIDRLNGILPSFGTANNPLDVTGGAVADLSILGRSMAALSADANVGLVMCLHDVAQSETDVMPLTRSIMSEIGAGLKSSSKTALLVQPLSQEYQQFGRELVRESGVPYAASSMAEIMKSIAVGRTWSEHVRKRRDKTANFVPVERVPDRPRSELETLNYLAGRGVPVIPMRCVTSAEEAASFAATIGQPVALKILSPDIAHKTEVGGVVLDVFGGSDVAAAFDKIIDNVKTAKPSARIEGVVVAPMRKRDVELFVGVARDPLWGLVLAVGLGGIWVEVLDDVSLAVLPVEAADVLDMLRSLKSGRLLDGYRGSPVVDRQALAAIVADIGDAALALGPELVSLEINPLNVGPKGIEALDGLAVGS